MYFGYNENGTEKPIMIQICRVSSPSINLIRYVSERIEDNKYDILVESNISDIGGSLYESPSSSFSNYGDARNFERSFFSDINSLTITVQIADLSDPNFVNPINYSSKTFNSSTPYPYSDSTKINITPTSESKEVVLDSNKYIRLLIEIIYGKISSDTTNYRRISSFSGTSIFYVDSPTISYRKNSIGINDESLNSSDTKVLSVKSAANKKDIVFEGLDGTTTRKTTIDLVSGEIKKQNLDDSVSICGVKTFKYSILLNPSSKTYILQNDAFINHSMIFINIDYQQLVLTSPNEASTVLKTYRDADLMDSGISASNQIELEITGTNPEIATTIPLLVTVIR